MHTQHNEPLVGFGVRDEIEFHVSRARDMRAEVTRDVVVAAGRGIAGLARTLAHRRALRREAASTRDALERRSDRLLADIGIAREDIPLIARGIDPGTSQGSRLRRGWRALRSAALARLEAHRERHRIERELMQYDDRELEEIGVRRRDIPQIAKGEYAKAA